MNASSLALLYGILWISSVHSSEDNNVRRLSKDIPEQDFADPQGGNTVLTSQDTESSDSQSQSFFRRNLKYIIIAFCVSIVVPVSIVSIVSAVLGKGQWFALVVAAVYGIFLFTVAYTVIRQKDDMLKEGLTPSWGDVLKEYIRPQE